MTSHLLSFSSVFELHSAFDATSETLSEEEEADASKTSGLSAKNCLRAAKARLLRNKVKLRGEKKGGE